MYALLGATTMSKSKYPTHLVIPDVQVKPGQNYDHLRWLGRFIADKQPDTIVCIGDFADMPSLSLYDVGKKSFEGRRYVDDVNAAIEAMDTLMEPINTMNAQRRRNKKAPYQPRKVLTLGNHEHRINRAIELDRKLEGLISVNDLRYEEHGWDVYPFLEPVILDGVAYCHYFVSGVMGRSVSSVRMLAAKKHMSCTMGHVQTAEIDMSQRRGDGQPIIGLFAGIYTPYDEEYLNPQTNMQHRQVWMKYEVRDGFYYPCPVSIEYLKEKYA